MQIDNPRGMAIPIDEGTELSRVRSGKLLEAGNQPHASLPWNRALDYGIAFTDEPFRVRADRWIQRRKSSRGLLTIHEPWDLPRCHLVLQFHIESATLPRP